MPSRRALLRAAAASSAVAATPAAARIGRGARADRDRADDPLSVPVHVHRVPSVPDDVHRRVRRAVAVGVEQVARHADAALDRPVEGVVRRGETAPRRTVVTATRTAVFDSTADWLEDVGARDDDAVHLLLVDEPFEQAIGYGGNRTHLLDGGPVSYANVGATERWDDAAVTGNMAVHEVLHALVTPVEVRAVLDRDGRGCEHDLGGVHAVGPRGAVATPLASAYADLAYGSETQWPGSGCLGSFSTDVGFDPDWWGHTYALSTATRAATARYLARA